MAKKPTESAQVLSTPADMLTIHVPADAVLAFNGNEYQVPIADIDPLKRDSACLTLMLRGYQENISNVGALSSDQKAALVAKAAKDGKVFDLEDYIHSKRRAKQDAALAGDITLRVMGPRLKGIDAVMRDCAEELLRANIAKAVEKGAKIKVPTDTKAHKDLTAALNKLIDKYADTVLPNTNETLRQRAQARIDADKESIDDDILASVGL